jgi:lipopolysaccharide transport system ATP-binding protein
MSAVITANGLGKQYSIGPREVHGSLRDSIARGVAAPFRRLRAIASGERTRPSTDIIWALRDASFQIEEGSIVGIIGRNGSGKSTLLKILARITEPTTGVAEVRGRIASLLEVGTGFHPELTGRENIYLNGAILGMRRAELAKKFDEIVEFSEVAAFVDTPVKRYSSGMALRLAFAVAAHLEPEILLVDEVLAVGDAAFQKKCLGKMGDVARSGRTILFVSHDLTAVQVLCQRVIRLAAGRVQGIGAVDSEISAYLADSRLSRTALDEPLSLSGDVEMTRFGFEATPLASGAPAEFRVELRSPRRLRIDELAVLVHDTLNRRVGVLDLRRPEGAYEVPAGEPFSALARLRSFALVEGEYRLGLSFRTNFGHDILYDLVTVEVVAGATPGFVPYSASIRGVVAFDYAVDAGCAATFQCEPQPISSS